MSQAEPLSGPNGGAPGGEHRSADSRPRFDRFTVGVAASVLALVGLALWATLSQRPGPAPADENSPAGVVYAYYLALAQDDPRRAYALLSSEAQSKQSYEQFAQSRYRGSNLPRARIDDERLEGDTARVTVRVTRSTGSFLPFVASDYSTSTVVVLRREQGGWKLTQPIQVW